MKLLHPDIPTDLVAVGDLTTRLRSDDRLRGLQVDQADLAGRRLKGTAIEESLLTKVDFSQTQIERFALKDCRLVDCDLTACGLAESSWHVVEAMGCRCSGLQLQNSQLKNILFKSCKLDLVNFRFAKLENVRFEDCLINELDFYNATLKNVDFIGSTIEDIGFAGAHLKNVDLSEAQIVGIKSATGLRGVTINYEQLTFLAPYFAQELNIDIKN